MSWNPLSGTAGAVLAIGVTPDLTKAMPTISGTPVAIHVRSWKIDPKVESGKSINFLSPANAQGVVFEESIQGGIGSWTIALELELDGDTTGNEFDSLFQEGAIVKMNLLHSQASALGRYGVVGKVTARPHGADVKATPQMGQVTLEGHGLIPELSTS